MARILNTNLSGFNPRQVNRQNSTSQNSEVNPPGPSPPQNTQGTSQQGTATPNNLNQVRNEAAIRQLNQDVIQAQNRTGRLVAEDLGLMQIEDGLRQLQQQAAQNPAPGNQNQAGAITDRIQQVVAGFRQQGIELAPAGGELEQALNSSDNLVASPPRIAAALSEVINERNEISQELAASQDFIQQRLDQLSEMRGQNAATVETGDQAQQALNEIQNQIQENPGGAMDSQANLTADNMQNLLG
jgi:chromosome segregation ATPase